MMPPTLDSEPAPDFKPKSKRPLIGAALVGLALGALGTVGVMLTLAPTPKKSRARPAGPVAAAPEKPPPPADAGAPSAEAATAKDPLAEKAVRGDPQAVEAIRALALEERTPEQIVALQGAAAQTRRNAIAALIRKMELVPRVAEERSTVTEVTELANDAQVANDLVLALANLPGAAGTELLYRIGPGSRRQSPAKELANDVLYAKGVRSKASPALAVYLDLAREDNDCQSVAKILERVKISGDRRALGPMGKLGKKTGCGPKQRDDCWRCLRKGDLLKDATVAARKRKK
jgi:hypothetical protein